MTPSRHSLRRAVVLALAVAALATAAPGTASSRASAAEVPVFTESDSGRTVHVARGSAFRIRLTPQSPDERWTPPTAGGDTGVYMAGLQLDETVTDAFFHARRASSNELSSRTDLPCFRSEPSCAAPSRGFSITVVVDDGPQPASEPAAPVVEDRPAPDAVELDRSNELAVFTVEVGQRVSIRLDGPYQGSAPGQLFLDRWYISGTSTPLVRTSVVYRAVREVGVTEVAAYGRTGCVYDMPPCPALIPRHWWNVAVVGSGMSPDAAALRVDPPTVTAGNTPVVTAVLTRGDGTAASGAVDLYAKAYGEESYRRIGVAMTQPDGTLPVVVRPQLQTAYVAVVRTVAGRLAATAVVRVHARIDVDTPRPGESVAARSTFTGRTLPVRAGLPVGLAVVRGGRYTYLGQGTTDANGRWSVTASLPRGTAAYVLYTSARAGTAYGSRSLQLTVR